MVCEALSLVCFAAMYPLAAGGIRWGLRRTTGIVLAANAVADALPGGAAFSAAWVFGQRRRRGVEQVLAAAVRVVAGGLSVLGLAVLIVAGMVAAGPAGLLTVLLPVAVVLLVLGVALSVFGATRFPGFRAAVGRV
ncbi:hypothetical protein SHL15_1182 [Streptomyces hygroscopicus subsp. limoneus]|nr:hypothetical protein SHL15_1182 [Streptomyces hygroscopicus subsp. limoneus]